MGQITSFVCGYSIVGADTEVFRSFGVTMPHARLTRLDENEERKSSAEDGKVLEIWEDKISQQMSRTIFGN